MRSEIDIVKKLKMISCENMDLADLEALSDDALKSLLAYRFSWARHELLSRAKYNGRYRLIEFLENNLRENNLGKDCCTEKSKPATMKRLRVWKVRYNGVNIEGLASSQNHIKVMASDIHEAGELAKKIVTSKDSANRVVEIKSGPYVYVGEDFSSEIK